MPDDPDPGRVAIEANRQNARGACRLHSRQALHAAQDLFGDRNLVWIFRVVLIRERHAERREMIRLESNIHVEQAIKALAQQPSADEQHDCDRQFDDYEICAKAAPESTGVAAPSFRQSLTNL